MLRCRSTTLLPNRLWSEEHFRQPALMPNRQASRSETERLTNFQMSRLAFNCLSAPSFREAGCLFVTAVPWARGLLLLLGRWLPMLHTTLEVSAHSNPWGTRLHPFLQGLFFLSLCNIVWEAAAKSCAKAACTFLVSGELSLCYRSRLCTSMYLFIPLTGRSGTLCTRLSREHVHSLTITHRQVYSLSETEEDTVISWNKHIPHLSNPFTFLQTKTWGKRWNCNLSLKTTPQSLPEEDTAQRRSWLGMFHSCGTLDQGTWLVNPQQLLMKERLFSSQKSNLEVYSGVNKKLLQLLRNGVSEMSISYCPPDCSRCKPSDGFDSCILLRL